MCANNSNKKITECTKKVQLFVKAAPFLFGQTDSKQLEVVVQRELETKVADAIEACP